MNLKTKFYTLLKWLGVCLALGIFCGVLGAAFGHTISFVTSLRNSNGWLILLLPVAGLLSTVILKALKVAELGTNDVLKSATGASHLNPLLAPAIFMCSALSHLCGASVGREGAALQLGGSLATGLAKLFKLDDGGRKILVYCGMAGLFSAVFGTPFAAAIFALEVVYIGKVNFKAIFPSFLTSFVAFFVSIGLKAHPERFNLNALPNFSFITISKTALISILTAFIGIIFCYSLSYGKKYAKKFINNDYLRIFLGSIAIIVLTAIIGHQRYNGAGVSFIESIFENSTVINEAFLIKILFTVIAISSGFRGGEIVPTLFIGAAFGSATAVLFGLPAAFGAAIGMTSLFCSVTNCLIASIVLAFEMFSLKGAGFIVLASILSFAVSGKVSLYSAQQRITFKKGANDEK